MVARDEELNAKRRLAQGEAEVSFLYDNRVSSQHLTCHFNEEHDRNNHLTVLAVGRGSTWLCSMKNSPQSYSLAYLSKAGTVPSLVVAHSDVWHSHHPLTPSLNPSSILGNCHPEAASTTVGSVEILPNRYCAQFRLPSAIVHSLVPGSFPAAPDAT